MPYRCVYLSITKHRVTLGIGSDDDNAEQTSIDTMLNQAPARNTPVPRITRVIVVFVSHPGTTLLTGTTSRDPHPAGTALPTDPRASKIHSSNAATGGLPRFSLALGGRGKALPCYDLIDDAH